MHVCCLVFSALLVRISSTLAVCIAVRIKNRSSNSLSYPSNVNAVMINYQCALSPFCPLICKLDIYHYCTFVGTACAGEK